jgi:hypothetical protein
MAILSCHSLFCIGLQDHAFPNATSDFKGRTEVFFLPILHYGYFMNESFINCVGWLTEEEIILKVLVLLSRTQASRIIFPWWSWFISVILVETDYFSSLDSRIRETIDFLYLSVSHGKWDNVNDYLMTFK